MCEAARLAGEVLLEDARGEVLHGDGAEVHSRVHERWLVVHDGEGVVDEGCDGVRVVDDGAGVVDLVDGYVLVVLKGDAGVVDLVGDELVLVEEGGGWDEVEECHGCGR